MRLNIQGKYFKNSLLTMWVTWVGRSCLSVCTLSLDWYGCPTHSIGPVNYWKYYAFTNRAFCAQACEWIPTAVHCQIPRSCAHWETWCKSWGQAFSAWEYQHQCCKSTVSYGHQDADSASEVWHIAILCSGAEKKSDPMTSYLRAWHTEVEERLNPRYHGS